MAGMVDLRWCSDGDLLLDGTGDLALSEPSGDESLIDVLRTRLKSQGEGWQSYPGMGAGLDLLPGRLLSPAMESQVERQVTQALIRGFIGPGQIQVRAVSTGNSMQIVVYVDESAAVTATVDPATGQVVSVN